MPKQRIPLSKQSLPLVQPPPFPEKIFHPTLITKFEEVNEGKNTGCSVTALLQVQYGLNGTNQ